jgi:hypothetical protein
MNKLNWIKREIEEIARVIDAPIHELLTFNISRDDGTPCIQIERDIIYYFARDRAVVCMHKQTTNRMDLYYWVFQDVTSAMSSKFAVRNAKTPTNFRRVLFEHQLELLGKINPIWASKRQQEIDEILESYPYNDESIRFRRVRP